MKVIKRIILYTLLAIGALVMVFPFFWMLLSSGENSCRGEHHAAHILACRPRV